MLVLKHDVYAEYSKGRKELPCISDSQEHTCPIYNPWCRLSERDPCIEEVIYLEPDPATLNQANSPFNFTVTTCVSNSLHGQAQRVTIV